jgi:hypothetical protein
LDWITAGSPEDWEHRERVYREVQRLVSESPDGSLTHLLWQPEYAWLGQWLRKAREAGKVVCVGNPELAGARYYVEGSVALHVQVVDGAASVAVTPKRRTKPMVEHVMDCLDGERSYRELSQGISSGRRQELKDTLRDLEARGIVGQRVQYQAQSRSGALVNPRTVYFVR